MRIVRRMPRHLLALVLLGMAGFVHAGEISPTLQAYLGTVSPGIRSRSLSDSISPTS